MAAHSDGVAPDKKSFWQHAWDVLGFTLVVYAGIVLCFVGTLLLLIIVDR